MLRAPVAQPIDATTSVALVLDGPYAHGFADRAEHRLLEAAGECAQRKAGRQSLHDRRRHALERMFVEWRRRCLRGAVVRGDREKKKQQEERLSTINSELSAKCQNVAEKMKYHPNSLRLDVGRADHLGPLLSFVGDELLERC